MHGIFNEAINMKLKKLSTTIGFLIAVTSLMAQQNPVFPATTPIPRALSMTIPTGYSRPIQPLTASSYSLMLFHRKIWSPGKSIPGS